MLVAVRPASAACSSLAKFCLDRHESSMSVPVQAPLHLVKAVAAFSCPCHVL